MSLPATNHTPPFNVTRASHVALGVTDLSRSLAFYQEVIGLVVTAREKKRALLRGVEEDAHHSLILAEGAEPACDQLGFRVFADEDLDRAAAWLEAGGLKPRFAEVPNRIAEVARPGDLVITMGIGNVYLLCDDIREACARRYEAEAKAT